MSGKKLRALDPLIHHDLLDEDLLHKESDFVERCYQLVDDVVEPPFAISIDGLWGTGKTTVMQMLRRKFQDRWYPIFWFNPWKYSRNSTVVLSFLQALTREHQSALLQIEKSGGKIMRVLLDIGMGSALSALTGGGVSLDDVKKSFKKEDLPFETHQDLVKILEEEFKELVNAISAAQKYQNKPLIVFLDDFDRCLPQDAIQLLEALKNLFVTKGCQVVFICGIDTRVAKNFIRDHYKVTEEFAINYFRKIFNLTLSMPYSKNLEHLLEEYIQELYVWEDSGESNTKKLAQKLVDLGRRAEISSVRKYLNVLNNFFAFLHFNPGYDFDPTHDFVLTLYVLKEAWQPLYESMVLSALDFKQRSMSEVVERLKEEAAQKETVFPAAQAELLKTYFAAGGVFEKKKLALELEKFPTLL
ncbi:MAG: hypothetical protein GY801_31910 [bacterium]|nr:hypothetical protein [bacterium]